MGIKVYAKTGENAENLVRRFSKIIEKSGLLKERRRREYFEKPSVRRRRDEVRMQKNAERERKFRERQSRNAIF